jgi:hypothetical protein
MDNLLYESSSGAIEFLLFQDSLNGLARYLEKMQSPLKQYLLERNTSIEEEKKKIKSGQQEYELDGQYFTKEEALLGLEFDDNYTGGTGKDTDFFPKYFYSSIVILSITILESLIKELVKQTEERTKQDWRPDDNVTLLSCINYLNKHGFTYNLDEEKEEYIKLNNIRKHFIHYLHRENFSRLSKEDLVKTKPSYDLARRSLLTVARIAKKLEEQSINTYK